LKSGIGRILITGGVGFIGSHIAEFYSKKKNDIVIIDNLSRAQLMGKGYEAFSFNWNYLKRVNKVTLIKGDVTNFEKLKEICSDVDAIVHAAAQTAVTVSIINPRTDFLINTLGTLNVLEAARMSKGSPSVIYLSTNKCYGENVNKIPIKKGKRGYSFADDGLKNGIPEGFPVDLCGHSPYGCSKLAGDLYAQDYAQTYGLDTGILRLSCVYGPRQFGVEDQGWLAWFTIATVMGKPLTVYGDGKQVRDVLYISDLVNACDAFIERKKQLSGEVFNIGGGRQNTLSLLELLDMLEQLTGRRSKISSSDWRQSDQKVYISDISKAKQKLGWSPKVGPREGVKKLVNWVLETRNLFI